MKKAFDIMMPAAAIVLSLGGIALYLVLFLPDFDIYALILAPVILALYQVPAAWVFRLWRRRRREERRPRENQAECPRQDSENGE